METTINLQERISEFAVKKEKEASNQEEYYKKKKWKKQGKKCKMHDTNCLKCTYLLAIFLDSC